MGSHKKPLCVGKCTSEDLDFIFFFLGWGEGGGGRRYVPSRLDSKRVFVTYLLSIALPMTHGYPPYIKHRKIHVILKQNSL